MQSLRLSRYLDDETILRCVEYENEITPLSHQALCLFKITELIYCKFWICTEATVLTRILMRTD